MRDILLMYIKIEILNDKILKFKITVAKENINICVFFLKMWLKLNLVSSVEI